MHIAVACRTKLGGIEPERVRVVYDEEIFDEQSGEWRFVFRTFARTKMALSYDPMTRQGVITGDLELMSMDSFESASGVTLSHRQTLHPSLNAGFACATDPSYALIFSSPAWPSSGW